MQVKITNVEVEWDQKGRNKFGKALVSYDYQGNPRQQKIMSFANPDVFKKVQEMVGQTVEVEVGKNASGFSEWKSIAVAGSAQSSTASGPSAGAPATRVSGSNYETKEERAARQVLIVKQSSLNAAVASLTPGAKAPLDPREVIERAQAYTDWVFEQPTEDQPNDDIPF